MKNNNKEWQISNCDTHAQVTIFSQKDPEKRIEMSSTTGEGRADIDLIGSLVLAHLNGELNQANLVKRLETLDHRVSMASRVLLGKWP
jgi:hypothetical protein